MFHTTWRRNRGQKLSADSFISLLILTLKVKWQDRKNEKQYNSMYILAFKYLNFLNQFNPFHGKNIDKRLKENYQAGRMHFRRIALESGLSSNFRVIPFNLLKRIEFIMPFTSSYAGRRIFSLSKHAGAELYIEFYELIREKSHSQSLSVSTILNKKTWILYWRAVAMYT